MQNVVMRPDKGSDMSKDIRLIEVDDFDHRLLVNSIMEFRNKVIQEGVSTEDVDDLLLRIIDAPVKKPKWRSHEER